MTPISSDTKAETCRKHVLPKLYGAGWTDDQISGQRYFTDGSIVIAGTKVNRRPQKRPDYLLRYARDFPLAAVEAKAAYKRVDPFPPAAPLRSKWTDAQDRASSGPGSEMMRCSSSDSRMAASERPDVLRLPPFRARRGSRNRCLVQRRRKPARGRC